MPEIDEGRYQKLLRYEMMGTPDEIWSKRQDLENDNRTQREEIRGLKEQVLPDGQIAVSKADADRLSSYKELGTPDEIKGQLEEGSKAQESLVKSARLQAAAGYAKAAGLAEEAAATLVAIPELKDATFTVNNQKVKQGEKEVTVMVPVLTIGDEELDFTKAQEQFPALKGLRPADAKPAGSAPLPFTQLGTGEQPNKGTSVYDRIREEAKVRKEASSANVSADDVAARLGMTRIAG